MSKYTSGPWTLHNHNAAVYAKRGQDNIRIASLSHVSSATEEEANARLIAAAPELLEALQAFLAWGEAETPEEHYIEVSGHAHRAILKATQQDY